MTDFKVSGLNSTMSNAPFNKNESVRKEGCLFGKIMRSAVESEVSVEYLPSVIKRAGGQFRF